MPTSRLAGGVLGVGILAVLFWLFARPALVPFAPKRFVSVAQVSRSGVDVGAMRLDRIAEAKRQLVEVREDIAAVKRSIEAAKTVEGRAEYERILRNLQAMEAELLPLAR